MKSTSPPANQLPPSNVDYAEVPIEEDKSLPELSFKDQIATHQATLYQRENKRYGRQSARPLGIKKTAAAKRRAAERVRLAGVDSASARLARNRPATQIDVGRIMESTQKENPEAPATAQSPSLEHATEGLVAQQRANALARLENGQGVSQSVNTENLTSARPVSPPSMQNFIDKLRQSPSSEGDNHETIPEPHWAQREDSHGEQLEQLEHNIERLLAETTAPVPDVPVERDFSQDAPEEYRRKIPAEREVAEEARRQEEAKKRAENAQRAVEESEDSFARTTVVDNLFSDEDEDNEDEGHVLPDEDLIWASPAELANHPSSQEHDKDEPAASSRALGRSRRKRFARKARHAPYQHPPASDQKGRFRRATRIDVESSYPDRIIGAQEDQPLPDIPPVDPGPSDEVATTPPIPDGHGNDRRRKAANKIQ